MSFLLSPWAMLAAGIFVIIAVLASPNISLWVISLLVLPLGVGLLGGRQAHRVLLWLFVVSWLCIICDIINYDLTGEIASEGAMGVYRVQAILMSLCAILALALGMRLGAYKSAWRLHLPVRTEINSSPNWSEQDINLNHVVFCYIASVLLTVTLGAIAQSIPGLTQPILALGSIKFVLLYLVAAKVFEAGSGYYWLILISLLEIATGLTGYFSSYKEAFIVILIALASSRHPLSVRMWFAGVATMVVVIWISLFWTVIKIEYRQQQQRNDAFDSVEYRGRWIAQRLFYSDIDYGDAIRKLTARIGYTRLYAQVLQRQDAGSIPDGFNFYASAVQNVLMPRIFFPNKSALDDSKITTALLGIRIDDGTSIGVGYIAQAQVDFGFPGLLLPILLIGFMIGAAAKYFMERDAPLLVREGFTTGTLFLSFPFAANIDKAFGGFVLAWLAMSLMLKYGYPIIAPWLRDERKLAMA